jgi:hypothetical protein
MPKIPLNDALGLDVDGKLRPDARILTALPQFLRLRDLPLDQVPLDQARAALTFTQPLKLPVEGLSLSAGVAGGGRIAVIRPERRSLDADDPFDAVAVAPDEIWVAAALHVSAQSGLAAEAGNLAGGLSLERGLALTCYRRFRKGTAFPAFGAALARVLSGFALPKNLPDALDLDVDVVLTVAGTGTVTVSGDLTLAMTLQPLASVSAAGVQVLQVKPAASVNLGASVEIEGDYQVRLRRLDAATLELGLYRLKSRTLEAHIAAQAGISVKAAGFDVAERLVGALSSQPALDLEEFRKALPGEDEAARDARIEKWQKAIQGAISTKVQASLTASLSRSDSHEAVWMYQVDRAAAASGATAQALLRALAGDFSPLAAAPAPAGVRQVQNVLTDTAASRQSLKLNLLGLVNAFSSASLARASTVERNAAGDVTLIVDSASSSRLRALLQNVGGDGRRLRRMLSENFLIEAAYQVAGLDVLPPGFQARHTFFTLDESTSREGMKNMLDVPRVLGLLTPAEAELRLGAARDFGAATLFVQLSYDHGACTRLFLDSGGNPRTVEDYETLGRSALGALLFGDAGQDLRRRFADLGMAGSELWRRMKQAGNTRVFGPLFGLPADANPPQLATAGSDFIVITDWARAMHAAALAVSEVPAQREKLKAKLAAVVRDTHDQFGDPLGLLMVYLAAGESAVKTVRLTGDRIQNLELVSGKTLAAS